MKRLLLLSAGLLTCLVMPLGAVETARPGYGPEANQERHAQRREAMERQMEARQGQYQAWRDMDRWYRNPRHESKLALQASSGTAIDQINAGIEIAVGYGRIGWHISLPTRRIISQEIVHLPCQLLQSLNDGL